MTAERKSNVMTAERKSTLVAGIFYLLTFVSIPTLSLYSAIHDPGYVIGSGPDAAALIGAILEWIVALSCIGTAVTLFPILKQQSEGRALGFVAARVFEATMIVAGIACVLTVVTLRQAGVGAEMLPVGKMLMVLYDRLFFLGQSVTPAVNAILLGSLLYQARLVPRALPLLGFVGALLLLVSDVAILFGALDRLAATTALLATPIALWEFLLGLWLIAKGFSSEPKRSHQANKSTH